MCFIFQAALLSVLFPSLSPALSGHTYVTGPTFRCFNGFTIQWFIYCNFQIYTTQRTHGGSTSLGFCSISWLLLSFKVELYLPPLQWYSVQKLPAYHWYLLPGLLGSVILFGRDKMTWLLCMHGTSFISVDTTSIPCRQAGKIRQCRSLDSNLAS